MTTIEFVGGPLCGHGARSVGFLTVVAVRAPVASYPMYSNEQGYTAVDPARCDIDTPEAMESPKHIYKYEAMGFAGTPILLYVGLQ